MVAFSTALMAGSSIAGAFSANKAAKFQAKMARYQADVAEQARKDQMSNNAANLQLAANEMRLRDEQNDYFKDIFRDQNLSEQERQRYLRGFAARNEGRLNTELERLTGRQDFVDDLAAEQRAFDLERIARDDRLTSQERQFALAELERERERARRQRREELKRIDRGDATVRDEYNERMSRLMEDRLTRQAERDFEIGRQNQVIAQAADTRNRLRQVLDSYGQITAPELVGQDEIDRRQGRYYDQFSAEIDSALDRALSTKEADLIRAGMDGGGSSNAQRAEILARIAPQYMKAQAEAARAAGGEVSNINKLRTDRFNNLRTALQDRLNQEQMAGTTGLDIEARLTNPQTSAVLDRNIGSAYNPYTARGPQTSMVGIDGPLRVGSEVRTLGNIGSGYGSTINMPNLNAAGATASGYASAPNLAGANPNQFFNAANTGVNAILNNATAAETAGFDRAATAASQAGSAYADVFKNVGALGDEFFNTTPKKDT